MTEGDDVPQSTPVPASRYKGLFSIGSILGCIAAGLFYATIGMSILFGISWGCAHRPQPDPAPCSQWLLPLALLAVTMAGFMLFWIVRKLADWTVDRIQHPRSRG